MGYVQLPPKQQQISIMREEWWSTSWFEAAYFWDRPSGVSIQKKSHATKTNSTPKNNIVNTNAVKKQTHTHQKKNMYNKTNPIKKS